MKKMFCEILMPNKNKNAANKGSIVFSNRKFQLKSCTLAKEKCKVKKKPPEIIQIGQHKCILMNILEGIITIQFQFLIKQKGSWKVM